MPTRFVLWARFGARNGTCIIFTVWSFPLRPPIVSAVAVLDLGPIEPPRGRRLHFRIFDDLADEMA